MPGPRKNDDHSFPRQSRLRGRSNFRAVWQGKGSQRCRGRYCEIAFTSPPSSASETAGTTRFGISVTKKVGNAIQRNRIKRVIREYLRNCKGRWPIRAIIVISIDAPVADENDLIAELEDMLSNMK